MNTSNSILFREDQRFRGHWLMLFVGVGTAIAVISGVILVVVQVIMQHPLGTRPMPDAIAAGIGIIEIAIGIGLVWLLWRAVLQVEVTSSGLFIRFRPFHRKTRQIDLSEVTDITAVRYQPIRDYGGWGLRRGRNSRCYNVSGEEGVRIDYANGYHVLVGSQQADQLAAALQQIWIPYVPTNAPEDGANEESNEA